MKLSITLPRADDAVDATYIDGLAELAAAVERAGLHGVAASDHPFPYVEHGRAGHQALDQAPLLTFVGATTTSVRLHFSLLIAGYRNPFLTARLISTVDVLSKGRVIAAIGAGYMRQEFDALGQSYDRRGDAVGECVAAMRAAWRGEPVFMSGHGWSAAGNSMLPRPCSTPHPPLWRGGNSARAIREAAAHFDGWTPFEVDELGASQTSTATMSPEILPAMVSRLHELAAEAGRTAPLDVCYVRTSRRWLGDDARIVEDLHALRAAGATWMETNIRGRCASEWIDCVEHLAACARSAGVL